MSKPSRLAKPSKQPPARKELPSGRSQMLSVGERLMRAGSEGNLVRPRPLQQPPQNPQEEALKMGSMPPKEPGKSNLMLCSPEDMESLSRKQSSADDSDQSDPWSPRTVPRRHTVGGPRSAQDVLTMQPHNIDRKREAFLEHLKQKYPHHASAIMGHQERLRDHARSPKHGPSPQPGVGDQGEHLSLASLESLEAMSEEEAPPAFTRGSRSRASLPVVRSTNQTKDRSLGVLYLQYGDETKQIRMPNEVTSGDTIRALFVSAFPQQLTMKMLESPSIAVYMKDDTRNMYYELTDVRNIMPHSCLKVYHKDPAQAFNHNSRSNNGDIRMQRERLYGSRDAQHAVRPPPGGVHSPVHAVPNSPIHTLQGSMSPPAARSMPSSPSRIPYGPRASATLPRDRLSSVPPGRSATPCPSAILERRDVKPDEDPGGKGAAPYADPYAPAEGRLSVASQAARPGDVVDGATPLPQQQHSLYRQKSRKYGESQLPPLGPKTPPSSPHRVNEVRMIDIHPGQGVHVPPQGVPAERASPVRRSLRKDSNGAMEVVARARANVASPVFADLPTGDRPFQGHAAASDPQTRERMKAMEQQIASLTGLVQHALFKPNVSGAKETPRTSSPVHSIHSGGVSPDPAKSPALLPDTAAVVVQPPAQDPALCSILSTFRRNVSELRLQLHQLRQTQLQNQDTVKAMLRRAEQEISGKVSETLRRLADPVQRQRSQVDEERHTYLAMEERVLVQLGELEKYVEKLKRESTSDTAHRSITLKDVEEGAISLRRVGEALAGLKGEFPALQVKMRAVLRVEVEAVRFLKEEPHKMDSMLKRVKALTDTLSGLRRSATEIGLPAPEPVAAKAVTAEATMPAAGELDSAGSSQDSPVPQPRSPATPTRSEVMPTSPVVVHRVRSAPVNMQPCQHSVGLSHHPSPPLTPTHGRDSPTVAKVSPRSRESSPALQKKGAARVLEGPPTPTSTPGSAGSTTPPLQAEVPPSSRATGMAPEVPPSSRATGMAPEVPPSSRATGMAPEAPESEQEEERSPSRAPSDVAEMEKLLQQTQASLMSAIPDLEVSGQEEPAPVPSPAPAPVPTAAPPALPDEVDAPKTVAPTPRMVAPAPKTVAPAPETVAPAPKTVAPAPKTMAPAPQTVASDPQTVASDPQTVAPTPETVAPAPKTVDPAPETVAPAPQTVAPTPETVAPEGNLQPVPVAEKPVQTAPERPHKPAIEKPHRPSMDRVKPSPEKAGKSPPPPPPRRSYPPGAGLTTGRSGEVIYTTRKEPAPAQEGEEETPQPKALRVPPEVKPKPQTPPPTIASANHEEEDEGDKIMAELQVFQKYTVKELEPKYVVDLTSIEPPVRALESESSHSLTDTKVIYYVTGTAKVSPERAEAGAEDQGEGTVPPSKVAHAHTSDLPLRPKLLTPDELPVVSHDSVVESQKESVDTQQTSLAESPTDSSGAEEDLQCPVEREEAVDSKPAQNDPEKQKSSTPLSQDAAPVAESWPAAVGPYIRVDPAGGSGLVEERAGLEDGQPVPLRSSRGRVRYTEDASLSPDLPGDEGPPPADNIAFMITHTKVQALSSGEYQELVNAQGADMQTVKVGVGAMGVDNVCAPENCGFDRKPVIIIFDEPMDIRQAYKRLSTIFECEEELERMLSAERIDEEAEEEEEEARQVTLQAEAAESRRRKPTADVPSPHSPPAAAAEGSSPQSPDDRARVAESPSDGKHEAKKKFKFKFPKKQLAAIGQALRTGTKTGKKTLQVVVYEDEEEADGSLSVLRETRRFEIKSLAKTAPPSQPAKPPSTQGRTEQIRKDTYKTLDSLEETIKQLESTISDMDPSLAAKGSCEGSKTKRSLGHTAEREGSPPKRLSPPASKPHKGPQRKKVKPQLLPRPSSSTSSSSNSSSSSSGSSNKQNTGGSPSSSRMAAPATKSRQQSGSTEKPGKTQKLQDSQRQFRQANGSAMKAGGDSKHAFLALPASKIPAFCPSSGKSSSPSAPNSNASKPTNPSSSSSSSSSSKSSIPCLSLCRTGRSSAHTPSNDSLRIPGPSHWGKGQNLSLSPQTQNGRPYPSSSCSSSSSSSSGSYSSSSVSPTSTSSSSSPSSPSLLSPTAVSQGGRSGRALHVPSFSSHRAQSGSSGQPTATPAPSSKDMAN